MTIYRVGDAIPASDPFVRTLMSRLESLLAEPPQTGSCCPFDCTHCHEGCGCPLDTERCSTDRAGVLDDSDFAVQVGTECPYDCSFCRSDDR